MNTHIDFKRCLKIIVTAIIVAPLSLLLIGFVYSYFQEFSHYKNKDNYVEYVGNVTDYHFYESTNGETELYIFFNDPDVSKEFGDYQFVVKGKSMEIITEKGIKDKIKVGSVVEFTAAPGIFGDGYAIPLVAITVDGDELLTFDEGYENLLDMYIP